MRDESKDELVARIVDFALEDMATWRAPTPRDGVGPVFPDVFPKFAEELASIRSELASRLQCFTVEELRRDFPETTTAELNPLFDRHGGFADLARRLVKLKRRAPKDYEGGWAIAEKEIDIAYWRGHGSYSLAEAAMLSVGRDPRSTRFDAVFQGYGRSDEADEVLYFLEDRYEAIASGLGLDAADPSARVDADAFFEWVSRSSVRIDPRFRRMLRDRYADAGRTIAPMVGQAPQVQKPLHGSSLRAHARILCAVASAKYGLASEGDIAKIARKIQHDGDLHGLTFDLKVVRKLLRLGFDEAVRGGSNR